MIAIEPDTKKNAIETKTFRPKTETALREWLGKNSGKRNLYFHVNPTTHDMSKKAKLTDIASVASLHVDIDPREGEDPAAERKRILGLLTDNLPEGVPAPTFIIFSGGGYQGFWKLAEPIPVDGDLARAEDAKRWNQQLEVLFGADHCHNIDRVMRLPGTINLPNKKKKKMGRVEVLAELVEFDEARVYPISQFTPLPKEPISAPSNDTGTVASGGDDLSALGLPDRLTSIILQGKDPDDPKTKDNSRSAWLFDATCSLLRCKVPADVVQGILTDPRYLISESVLEKGAPEKYARRQITEAAKEVAKDASKFQCDENGVPYKSQHNIRAALNKLGVKVSHDQFADRLLIKGLPDFGPVLQDEGVSRLWLIIEERYHFRPTKDFF